MTTHDQNITILTSTVFLVHECIGLDNSTSRSNALVFAGQQLHYVENRESL